MRRSLRMFGLLALAVCLGLVSPVAGQPSEPTPDQPQTTRRPSGVTFEQFAHRHDANMDGKITLDEYKGNPQVFKQRDSDGDGVITEAEFMADAERREATKFGGGVKIPEGVKVHYDLEYAVVDGQSLKLDLYIPEHSEVKPPLLVWIHGGGWTRGSKSQFNPMFVRLSGEGYATASVEYRLDGLQSHPKQIHDCKGAIRWLRSQADKYGYDATRIGLGGGSAGGHLALLLGLGAGVEALEGDVGGNLDQSSQVSAIVDLFGPITPGKREELSPLTYLDASDPPVIIFHGDQDPTVNVSESELLHERYQQAGLESSLYIIPGAAHGGMVFSDAERYALVKAFLGRHIKQGNAPIKPEASNPPAPAETQAAPKADNTIPAGVYYTGNAGGIHPELGRYEEVPELAYPYVTGISFRQFWRNIEPKRGEFDWAPLDNAQAHAKQHGKWLMITITGGMGTPDWVYDMGAKSVLFDTSEANWLPGEKPVRMVVPWDETYLDAWDDFLAALGEKIRDWDNVYCIHMTGGGFISEMHLPKKSPDTIRQWTEAGISDEVCTQMWKRIIEAYDRHIPQQIGLSLASGVPFRGSHSYDAVYEWAKAKYGDRVWYQHNSLAEKKFDMPTNSQSVRLTEASAFTTVGWQMSYNPQKDIVGDRHKAYQHALDTNSSFVEVYPVDLNNPDLRDALSHLNDGLKENHQRQH